jgi:hypothetical protein
MISQLLLPLQPPVPIPQQMNLLLENKSNSTSTLPYLKSPPTNLTLPLIMTTALANADADVTTMIAAATILDLDLALIRLIMLETGMPMLIPKTTLLMRLPLTYHPGSMSTVVQSLRRTTIH